MEYASYGTDEAVNRGRRFIKNLNEELEAAGLPHVGKMTDRQVSRYCFLSSKWGPTIDIDGGFAICRRSSGGNPEKVFLSQINGVTIIE